MSSDPSDESVAIDRVTYTGNTQIMRPYGHRTRHRLGQHHSVRRHDSIGEVWSDQKCWFAWTCQVPLGTGVACMMYDPSWYRGRSVGEHTSGTGPCPTLTGVLPGPNPLLDWTERGFAAGVIWTV
jgi:hypothetical protein